MTTVAKQGARATVTRGAHHTGFEPDDIIDLIKPNRTLILRAIQAETWPHVQPGTEVTETELRTIRHLLILDTYANVAEQLGISKTSVKRHVAAARVRLGQPNVYALIRLLAYQRLI